MKIDLKKNQIFSYTNVIVEKNEPELKLPTSIPVYKNYNPDDVIGTARPRYLNGAIVCNIDTFENCNGFYPGICHNVYPENDLIYLSLGDEPNIDNTIKKLCIQ